MFAISPQLSKIVLALLLLTPWFSLYQKILFPHFSQTGFDGSIIILVELIFIIFVAVFGKHPKPTKDGLYLLLAVSGWHITGFISAYLGEHFYPSLIKQIEYLIHCIFAYSAWIFLSQTQKQERMAWFLVFTFIWVIYYILGAWSITEDTFNFNWVHGTPMFNNIRHLGYLQVAVLPFLLLPLIANKNYKYLTCLFLLTVFWSSVIWSGARSTFLASILLSISLIWFYKQERRALSIMMIASLIVGWLNALQFPSNSSSMDPYRLLFLESRVGNADLNNIADLNKISSGRIEIWSEILTSLWPNHFLVGHGADNYSFMKPLINFNVSQAHNTFFQLLSGVGVVGMISITLAHLFSINLWLKIQATKINIIARFSFIGVLCASMLDGHFYHTFSLLWIMIILSLCFPHPQSKQETTRKRFIMPILIISASCILIFNLQKHWQSYIQQQFPLEYAEQLKIVQSYPSFYRPTEWIYREESKQELRSQAIELGKTIGPRHCNFHLIEFMEAPESNLDSLENGLASTCSKSELVNVKNERIQKYLNKGVE
ncbi:MAG: O-antigen ligase family protein [Oceanospirillaceae bacterium]|nr:O-antigen ligase family protein [Oceanospirillaceae bacterium]